MNGCMSRTFWPSFNGLIEKILQALPRASCMLITKIFRSDPGNAALFCIAHDTFSTDLPDQVPPVFPVVTGDGHHIRHTHKS